MVRRLSRKHTTEVLPALAAVEMVLADASSAAMQQRPSPQPALAADLPFKLLGRTWLMPLARRDGTQHNTCLGLG